MSVPFRRWPDQRWADEPAVDLGFQRVGRRLDLPLRMAASIDRTLAQFSTGDEAILSQGEAEAAVRLVGRALDPFSGAPPEDVVADALDRVEWTVPLVKVARLRRLWDEFWTNAVEEVREVQVAAATRAADRAMEEARAEAEAEAAADRGLPGEIRRVPADSRGRYGGPRVHAALRAEGVRAGQHRVAGLMRRRGIAAANRDGRHAFPPAPNLLRRRFTAAAPNRVWLADPTCIRIGEGWLHLAAIIDLFSRKVVGWAMADHMRGELTLAALRMAVARQRPGLGLIQHSDRGVQLESTYSTCRRPTQQSRSEAVKGWIAGVGATRQRPSRKCVRGTTARAFCVYTGSYPQLAK